MNKTPYQKEQDYKAFAIRVENAMNQLGAPNTLSRSVVASGRDFIERGMDNGRTPAELAKTLYNTYGRR